MSRSRKTRSTITSRCRAGKRRSARERHCPGQSVRDRPPLFMVVQRHLAGPAPPPRGPGIKRGAHNPRPRSRMSPDLPPRGPGPRERLGDLLLGLGHVASTRSDRAQARIPALLEELGEPFLIATHNRLTATNPKRLHQCPRSRQPVRGDLPQSTNGVRSAERTALASLATYASATRRWLGVNNAAPTSGRRPFLRIPATMRKPGVIVAECRFDSITSSGPASTAG